ncbi:putative P-loop containing nucleoside triphosphate hydrolase, leucine-rich repeat domain, L [Rosa chinensis]|uniref:Putative P-loop containing nucleoside triphosphate hydrolase, leucine-rich repeat domain, L n=2 Tax=Rosa chinensis TaxID=74649 RepID=A0A2P6S1Z8_ROSCH|nr:putative P-loop containing nucleoside triphosphate hydrolase, leucine-rich repeat domain, L [Rosa chinensis]
MGGIGKTTLSQLVYNDRKVRAHFDKRIWICVSDPFEEIQILAAIAQGLDIPYHPKANALETYSQFIYDSIKDVEKKKRKIKKKEKTKFLIVLDDVWNPTAYQWEQVIKPLSVGAKGSKILVTTRIEKVAVMMGVANNVIHLEMLSEEYCRLLFFHFASMGSRERKETRMLEVGNELVKKCKGLPLAAKTLGSLMRGKKTLEEWEGVLNSRIWKLKEFEENVFQPLLLSYYDLAPTIRRCLLYCAIFPKDYQMDRVDLIHLWMSQDYLNVKEKTEDIYMIGEAYFEDLVMRSFFQDFKRDVEGNISCFKMHDIVHDFVQYLTNNEISILDVRYPNRRLELPNAKVHHVNLTFDNESLLFPPANLRTVILDGYWGYGAESLFQLKSLRTLKMSKFWGIIPNELGGLIHLRYLNLSNNHSEELPESMCELYNLQTLIVAESSALQRLPQGVGKLINLRHLDVRGCIRLRLTGIGKLAGLRTVLS